MANETKALKENQAEFDVQGEKIQNLKNTIYMREKKAKKEGTEASKEA